MREYLVSGTNLTVAGATTLCILNPPTGRSIQIIRCEVSQIANATSAQVAIGWGSKASAFGTYTGFTPEKQNPSDPVSYITTGTAGAAGTCGINASAEGAGTFTTKYSSACNALQGWLWTPSMNFGEAPIYSSADSLAWVLRFIAAPTTLSGWNFTVGFREIG